MTSIANAAPEDARLDVTPSIVREYVTAPLLALTVEQARRLWAIDDGSCRAALDRLLRSGFLARRADGRYVLASPRA
jgi:predicted transcriptional regulator of viral defense system